MAGGVARHHALRGDLRVSYRVAYGTSAGNTTFRVIEPTPFSTIEEATRLMRAYKRRGLWAWIEDDRGNFIPVPGAKSDRVRKGYPLRSEQHATKKTAARGRGAQKSPAQLDREIAAALSGRSAHATKSDDARMYGHDELLPTAEARRHVQTIRRREE